MKKVLIVALCAAVCVGYGYAASAGEAITVIPEETRIALLEDLEAKWQRLGVHVVPKVGAVYTLGLNNTCAALSIPCRWFDELMAGDPAYEVILRCFIVTDDELKRFVYKFTQKKAAEVVEVVTNHYSDFDKYARREQGSVLAVVDDGIEREAARSAIPYDVHKVAVNAEQLEKLMHAGVRNRLNSLLVYSFQEVKTAGYGDDRNFLLDALIQGGIEKCYAAMPRLHELVKRAARTRAEQELDLYELQQKAWERSVAGLQAHHEKIL